jgi:hypothetical protein
VLSIVFC